jgi:hypothetical protein
MCATQNIPMTFPVIFGADHGEADAAIALSGVFRSEFRVTLIAPHE